MIVPYLCYTLYVCLEKGDNMMRFVKGIKITAAVVAFLGIIMFSMLSYASSKTEDQYRLALDNKQRGNYLESIRIVESIPHYKNSSELYIYLYPHKLFTDKYNNLAEKTEGFKKAVSYIKKNKDFLKSKGEDKYVTELSELEKVLNFKIEEMGIQIADEASKKVINEGADLIKQGDYPKALEKLNTIAENNHYAMDKHQLINYINLINAVNANDNKAINGVLELLNPNYTGILGEDIKKLALSIKFIEEWNSLYTSKNNAVEQKPTISVGMKKDSLLQLMGNPASSTVIANNYGNFEKMVYGNTIIYLEKGTVTAVK